MDPLTVLLFGTCIAACWPCFLPCCLAFPIVPFPLIIVEPRKPPSKGRDERDVNNGATTQDQYSGANIKVNSKLYYVCVTRSGVVLKKK